MRTRDADFYERLGHPFSGVPLDVIRRIGEDGKGGVHGFMEDFHPWRGPLLDGTAGGWTATSVDGGGDTLETLVERNAAGGGLRITTNNADNDNTQLQRAAETFKYVAGKRLWVGARLAAQDANDGEIGFGLIIGTDTDMVNTLPTDGIFFEKAETATDLDFHCRKNGTSTEKTAVIGTAIADTVAFIVGFMVDEYGNVFPFHDGAGVGALVLDSAQAVAAGVANIPDDEELTVAVQIQTGAAATRYLDVNWLFAFQER